MHIVFESYMIDTDRRVCKELSRGTKEVADIFTREMKKVKEFKMENVNRLFYQKTAKGRTF